MNEPEYWPGTKTPKSTNNGFTHGYGDRPWWEGSGQPRKKPTNLKPGGGFGANGGTIQHLLREKL